MKNVFINYFLSLILTIPTVYSEVPLVPDTTLSLESKEENDESFVIQHKDIEIVIGNLKIKAPFLYQGEVTSKQGYIISIRDTVRIKDIVEGCQSSCDILTNTLIKSCNDKIKVCQKNCDDRIKLITKENESLRVDIKVLESDVANEKNQKYIWATAASIAGAGLGILVYEISK